MRKTTNLIVIIVFITNSISYCQNKTYGDVNWVVKEFNKDIALYNSKRFLFRDVLGITSEVERFEVIPLAAANSGELTTLIYKCESKQKEGLVIGFYGNYWNDNGIIYQGYDFKNLNKDQAIEFLNKIQSTIDTNSKFLKENSDNNNVYFRYDDIDVLIWSSYISSYTIRLFWKGFDATWEQSSFERSKRRFERKIK